MPPIFKCLVCRKDIERSTKTVWVKKGHLLCSSCLDKIDKMPKKNPKMGKKGIIIIVRTIEVIRKTLPSLCNFNCIFFLLFCYIYNYEYKISNYLLFIFK